MTSLKVLIKNLPTRYTIRNGSMVSPNRKDIILATNMRPILKSTKNQQRRVADILAMQMKNTMWESHI